MLLSWMMMKMMDQMAAEAMVSFSVIVTGGLTTPGHFLKALALGAGWGCLFVHNYGVIGVLLV